MSGSSENAPLAQFIQATQSVSHSNDVSQSLVTIQRWQTDLWQSLHYHSFELANFNPSGDIAQQIHELDAWIEQAYHLSQVAYKQLSSAQNLIQQFEQKIILLIFGKFNAGKSSLCNVLAECFRRQAQTVQYFFLDEGDIVLTEDSFKEGATETTARLQGVCLGEHLVLLDTPGLHSVTSANASLTQRFLESADGVLWLSSASSPGQFHELDSLVQELLRQKPLLPIITRSDYFEEDEIDGEICQVLHNKPLDQRHLQEQDVKERAIEKLVQMHANPALLKSPISLSAYMASQADFVQAAMVEAGFDRLFVALYDFIQPAIAYKQRKPAEIVLHHSQEQIIHPLTQDFEQKLNLLETTLQVELASLDDKKSYVIDQVWRDIVPNLPALMDTYYPLHSTESLLSEVGINTHKALQHTIDTTFYNAKITLPPWDTLALQDKVVYQADENHADQKVAHEELLYKNICNSLTQALTQTMGSVVKGYDLQLHNLLDTSQALRISVKDYQHQLDRIVLELRTA